MLTSMPASKVLCLQLKDLTCTYWTSHANHMLRRVYFVPAGWQTMEHRQVTVRGYQATKLVVRDAKVSDLYTPSGTAAEELRAFLSAVSGVLMQTTLGWIWNVNPSTMICVTSMPFTVSQLAATRSACL